jgi:hypothetical protein
MEIIALEIFYRAVVVAQTAMAVEAAPRSEHWWLFLICVAVAGASWVQADSLQRRRHTLLERS